MSTIPNFWFKFTCLWVTKCAVNYAVNRLVSPTTIELIPDLWCLDDNLKHRIPVLLVRKASVDSSDTNDNKCGDSHHTLKTYVKQNMSIKSCILASTLTPVVEELVFRYIPYYFGLNPHLRIAIAGPIFGLCHMYNYFSYKHDTDTKHALAAATLQSIDACLIGINLYMLFTHYQNILVPISFHAITNAFVILSYHYPIHG